MEKKLSDYTNYCTEKQTMLAYKLGVPVKKYMDCWKRTNEGEEPVYVGKHNGFEIWIMTPTTQQMIAWLREKKNIEIVTYKVMDDYSSHIWHEGDNMKTITKSNYKDAELEAITSALAFLFVDQPEIIL